MNVVVVMTISLRLSTSPRLIEPSYFNYRRTRLSQLTLEQVQALGILTARAPGAVGRLSHVNRLKQSSLGKWLGQSVDRSELFGKR